MKSGIKLYALPTSGMWHLLGDKKSIPVPCHCFSHAADTHHQGIIHKIGNPIIRLSTNEFLELAEDGKPAWKARPVWKNRPVCLVCFDAIQNAVVTYHRKVKENMKKTDLTKPIVVGPHGETQQAEKNTIAAAKQLARSLAAEHEEEYIVFAPHTSYKPKVKQPPIVETRFKVR